MSYQNSNPLPGSPTPPASGFSAQSQMGLAEVLQMCCLSRRSGQITFRSGQSSGFVYIQHGRVLHALCGTIEGEEAIYAMLLWPGGGFSLDEDILPHKKTVTLTWEQLLFEGARRADGGITESGTLLSGPIITAEPVFSSRTQESQPKLTIIRPDLPPIAYELVHEYTHAGRAPGNEISLPYPSISSRHCIFVLSGSDIVLRDLNSSNGTIVNGEAISEVILLPGDLIQIGVVQIKFEPGIKRPKLQSPLPTARSGTTSLKTGTSIRDLVQETVKLPSQQSRVSPDNQVVDDRAYMKGESAINYNDLAKPELEKKSKTGLIIALIAVLVLVAGACYYFFFAHGAL